MLDFHRREEVRFVATNLCSIVTEGKKYDLLSSICARLSQKGRSTICCHQFVIDCYRRAEGEKYDLMLPIWARLSQKGRSANCSPICARLSQREEVRFVATNLCSIVTEGKKYDLLPPICARLSQKGRCTIGCHQFVLDCHRKEEVRFVATSWCSMITEGKKYDLLPPICVRLS